MLVALADQNIERLNAKLEVHEQTADAQAERTFAHLSFDPSPEGEVLRNHLIKCTNSLFRGIANYRKHQAENKCLPSLRDGTVPPGPIYDLRGAKGDFPASHSEPIPEAQVSDASELGADDSLGSGAGQDDRPERAAVIDPDGVERYGDFLGETGEIGENAANEANGDESMSILETQGSIEVTADSDALSGLDKGVAHPEELSAPEQGEAPGSASATSGSLGAALRAPGGSPPPARSKVSTAPTFQSKIAGSLSPGSESGGAKPATPSSSDRACRGSSPATVSKREKRRLRRDKERRAVERMVEEKLKAGNFAPGEILMTALAMALPGGRGP